MTLDTPYLTDRHHDFRAEVRNHLDPLVRAQADVWEEQGYISAQGWRALGDRGLLSLGHAADGFLYSAVFLEELGRTGT
jgi:hypothetical protein